MSVEKPLTRNQRLVLGILQQHGTPLSAYDVLDQLREEGLKAPLQIYRALEALMASAKVHRLESLNAFIACSAKEACHSAHDGAHMIGFTICSDCGEAEEFTDDTLASRLEHLAQSKDFQAAHTVIEIKGTCAKCARMT